MKLDDTRGGTVERGEGSSRVGASLRVGHVFGIAIRLHVSLLLVAAWWLLAEVSFNGDSAAAVRAAALIVLVFMSILLHELGHAVTARHFGCATRDITLYPFGGIATLEKIPDKPREEILVALAGPAVNVVIAVGLFLVGSATSSGAIATEDLLGQVMGINATLAAFNLLPAFPMDGGRVLRALLTMGLGEPRATLIAVRVGQAAALILASVALAVNFMFLVIAGFIWIAGAVELAAARRKALLSGVEVQSAMMTRFELLPAEATLLAALELASNGFQSCFPVLHDGKVSASLTAEDLRSGIERFGVGARVAVVATGRVMAAAPGEPLLATWNEAGRRGASMLVVLERGELRGIVTEESVSRLIQVRAAVQMWSKADERTRLAPAARA